ncbi:MAG: hypothetical protein R2757_11815 [Draconibacterium sp.]
MDTFFNGPGDKEEMNVMYLQKLDELLVCYELKRIETTYGDTCIVITGEKENPPLVLLYGLNSSVSCVGEMTLNLARKFRIYVVNVSARPNLSDGLVLNINDDSYGKWMYEILSRFGVRDAFLVGISLGGFVALKFMAFDEKRIAKAFLITPAGIVNGSVFENIPVISLISIEEAGRIKTPLHIFTTENDGIFPGETLQEQATKIFPSLTKIIMLKESKHRLSECDNNKITEIIRNNIGL